MRICSLLPSATEIVAALGLADSLVGISDECDFPPEVRGLPVVSASRVDPTRLSSLEIDATVREALVDGRSLYVVDEKLVEALAPDLILTQDLCAVCAASSRELCELPIPTLSLDAHTIDEIKTSIRSLAEALGVAERARAVVAEMQEQIGAVEKQVAGASRASVFVAEWLDPPYAAGHWVAEMVALAGGREVLGRAGAPSFPTSWETVIERRPELIVLAPCGFDHTRAAREARLPDLGSRVVAVDASSYYARPGPRVADGVAQLAFLLHPDRVADPGLPYVEVSASRRPVRSFTKRRLSVKGS